MQSEEPESPQNHRVVQVPGWQNLEVFFCHTNSPQPFPIGKMHSKQFSWIFTRMSMEVILRIVSKLVYNLGNISNLPIYGLYSIDPKYHGHPSTEVLLFVLARKLRMLWGWRRVVDVWCRVASTRRWLLLCRWLVSDWGWLTCWFVAFAGIHPEISKTFLHSILFVCFFPEVLQVCIGLGDDFF